MAQKLFDVRKYQDELPTLVDGSDSLANEKELVISFYHVPSKRSVFFKAYITAFSETYNSNFTPTEAFGRTDPIYQYKSTTRKISLTFEVPAASEGEAYENLGKVSALEQMLYASYSKAGSATTLSQAPLIRLKVMNLLQKPSNGDFFDAIQNTSEPRPVFYETYSSNSDSKNGLLGVVDNLSVNHNITGDDGVFHKGKNTILPKNIELSLGFSPIHETTIGWDQQRRQQSSLFPYGVITEDVSPKLLDSLDQAYNAYNKQTQDQRDEELKRKASQQRLDNAAARYTGVLGGMRMTADLVGAGLGSERATERLTSAFEEGIEALEQGIIEADFEGFIE